MSVKGKQYYTTYEIPGDKKYSPSKLEQEIAKYALNFKEKIRIGFRPTKWKFSDYADYVLDTMKANGVKKSTIFGYRKLLDRINPLIGNIDLEEITPQDLNRAYQSLQNSTKKLGTAVCKPVLNDLLKEKGVTQASIHKSTGIARNTLTNAFMGRVVALDTANRLAEYFGCKTEDLFEIQKNKDKLAPKTVSSHAKLIGVILTQAHKEMIVTYNAYELSQTPKSGSHEADYFEIDEIVHILECLENEPLKWQVVMHMLIILGGRRGEIAGLQFDKIDWDNKQIRLNNNLLYNSEDGVYEDTTKSASGNRYMPLPDKTIELLKEYVKWYNELKEANGDRWIESGYMFVQDNGKPMNPSSITSYCRKFGLKYGIEHCHPHKFRHSYASTLIANKIDDVSLAKSLGHSRASTTKNLYGHVMDKVQDKTATIISDAYLK